jgi:hypothetical protein
MTARIDEVHAAMEAIAADEGRPITEETKAALFVYGEEYPTVRWRPSQVLDAEWFLRDVCLYSTRRVQAIIDRIDRIRRHA